MNDATQKSVLERLSTLSAIILLANAVTPFVDIPAIHTTVPLFGILLDFQFDFSTYISIIVPAFAAVGMYWLIAIHPARQEDRYPFQHSILPAITAWVISLTLLTFPNSEQRWVFFSLGGILLISVFIAEYDIVDLHSERHTVAVGMLKAISMALFLFLAIAVRSSGLRLYMALPALCIPVLLVLLRTLYLQTSGKWLISWSIGITIIIGQLVVAFHYLPISSITYGILLVAPLYSLTDFANAFQEQRTWHNTWISPAIIMSLLLLLGFLVR